MPPGNKSIDKETMKFLNNFLNQITLGPLTVPFLGSIPGFFLLRPMLSPGNILHFKAWEYFHICSKKFGGLFSANCGKFTAGINTYIRNNNEWNDYITLHEFSCFHGL
jgi:hypothetical protein